MLKSRDITLNFNKNNILTLSVLLQILFIFSIIFNWLFELKTSFFRWTTGFLYITFVPGMLLLIIFKLIHKLNVIEAILFSIGLSISTTITITTLVNFLLPLIGIAKPINEGNIVIAYLVTTCILTIIAKKRKYQFKICKSISYRLINYSLVILFLPILSVIGAYYIYALNTNSLMLLIIFILSLMPFIAYYVDTKVSQEIQPMLLWAIALSLVLYNSVFGKYMRPTDNLIEIYFSRAILEHKLWSFSIPNNINAMLGVVFVLSTYNLIMKCGIVYLYKLFIPLISSFIPLGIYRISNKRLKSSLYSFYSSFFFISMFIFFTWASITLKMVVSGIFLDLLVILIFSKKLDLKLEKFLLVIFTFSLIVSHYGTAYIIALALTFVVVSKFLFKFRYNSCIDINYFMVYITLMLGWYIYISSGTNFGSVVYIVKYFINSMLQKYILPKSSYGVQVLIGKFPIYLEILKILYIIAYIAILIGILSEIYRRNIDEYTLMSLPFTIFLILPYITKVSQYAGGRMWLISGYFLSPYFVKGFIIADNIVKNIIKKININIVIGLFLFIFILFNSGFAAEVIWHNNISPSVYISKPRICKCGSLTEKEYFDRVYLSVSDVSCAKWLRLYILSSKSWIFCGENAEQNLLYTGLTPAYYRWGTSSIFRLTKNIKKRISKNNYVYLTKFNIIVGKIKSTGGKPATYVTPKLFNLSSISTWLSDKCLKIYSNGYNVIYYKN